MKYNSVNKMISDCLIGWKIIGFPKPSNGKYKRAYRNIFGCANIHKSRINQKTIGGIYGSRVSDIGRIT
jgi:hypothetical protein